jgi:hypothetical protein
VLLVAGIILAFVCLIAHSHTWRVGRLESEELARVARWHAPETAAVVDQPDPLYTTALLASAGVSLAALLVWVYLVVRSRRSGLA